jgi:tetratricopeptide (TPR) repeat protein
MTQPLPRPVALRASLAIALWTLVLAILALVLLGDRDPVGALRVVTRVFDLAGIAMIALALVALAAVLLWPPSILAVRIWLRRQKDKLGVDERPLVEAQARLAHFENAADLLTLGRGWLRRGEAKRAATALARAVELDAQSPSACWLLGEALRELGDLPNAAAALRRAVELDESIGFGAALLAYGTLLERLGEATGAEAVLARHEARHGPSRRADLVRARAARARGDHAAAAAFVERAARPIESQGPVPLEERHARACARVERLRRRRR